MNRANDLGCHQRISREDACERWSGDFAAPQTHRCIEYRCTLFEIFHVNRKGRPKVSETSVIGLLHRVKWRHMEILGEAKMLLVAA